MLTRALCLLIACSGLVGCNTNPLIVEISDCPAVGFVRYANALTAFPDGVTPVAGQVSHKALFSSLNVDCRDLGEGVRTYVDFVITAEAGPRMAGNTVDVAYFVVIAREGDDLQSKEIHPVTIPIQTTDGRGRVRERLEFTIPTDRLADRYKYEVLIGFELTDSQARYNLET